MTTFLNDLTYNAIEASINTLGMQTDAVKAVLPGEEHPADPTARMLKFYAAVKPFLTAIAGVPVIPVKWRAALSLFLRAVDAVADGNGGPSPSFKGGMDLEQ